MVLGDLPIFKKLLSIKENIPVSKTLGKHIDLCKLEVVQLFHVSPVKNRPSILTYGLIPTSKPTGSVITYGPRIFVSTTFEEAAFDYVSYEDVDIWTFYLPKHFLYPDELSSYANHYYIEVSVPWYKLTLLETI